MVREVNRRQTTQASETLGKGFLYPQSKGQKSATIRFVFCTYHSGFKVEGGCKEALAKGGRPRKKLGEQCKKQWDNVGADVSRLIQGTLSG